MFGRWEPLKICRTSSSCPYDSIRSASSITRVSKDINESAFEESRAKAREGVEITMSGLSDSNVLTKVTNKDD